jgi:hypothetical protein
MVQEENDYGFSMSDEPEIPTESIDSLREQIFDLKSRIKSINNIFMPLLLHLAKDPDKPIIKWPNRKQIIDEQIEKLKNLTDI